MQILSPTHHFRPGLSSAATFSSRPVSGMLSMARKKKVEWRENAGWGKQQPGSPPNVFPTTVLICPMGFCHGGKIFGRNVEFMGCPLLGVFDFIVLMLMQRLFCLVNFCSGPALLPPPHTHTPPPKSIPITRPTGHHVCSLLRGLFAHVLKHHDSMTL